MKSKSRQLSLDSNGFEGDAEDEDVTPDDAEIVATSIYYGDRGSEFKKIMNNLFQLADLKQQYVDLLLSEDNMAEFGKAFTACSAHDSNNYEVYEQRGDVALGHFLVAYFYDRFPALNCPEGVKVVARLKINYGSKNNLCKISQELGFWPLISASVENRSRNMKKLLEDTFEAFIGCVEFIIDRQFTRGVGYAIVYKIMAAIFRKIPISLAYTSLYDAKTRLKQLVDLHRTQIGELVYREERNDLIVISRVYSVGGTMWPRNHNNWGRGGGRGGGRGNEEGEFLGQGSASLKADAQQKASEQAIVHLARNGVFETIPTIYSFFNSS
jgi:dsRNA-specific ribonuclease